MALIVTELTRLFKYNSVDLPDPGPDLSAEDVRELYSATYPEILNASIEGPEEKDGSLVYTFKRAVGTKGGARPAASVRRRAVPLQRDRNRRMTKAQKKWCENYQHYTTFEPLMDDFLAGRESFVEAAKGSIAWFRDWFEEQERFVSGDIPGADE